MNFFNKSNIGKVLNDKILRVNGRHPLESKPCIEECSTYEKLRENQCRKYTKDLSATRSQR